MKYLIFVTFLLTAIPVFAAAPANVTRQEMAISVNRQDIADFNKMDSNKDNRISKPEYLAALQAENLSVEQVQKGMVAFDQIDLNGDGYISLSEYKKFMDFAIETINNVMKSMPKGMMQK